MSDVEAKNITAVKIPRNIETSEQRHYVDMSEGVNCPIYDTCQSRRHGGWCLEHNRELFGELYDTCIIDSISDENELESFRSFIEYYHKQQWVCGRAFQLVEALANRYLKQAKLVEVPVTTEFVNQFNITPGIEISLLHMKDTRGAVWSVDDSWIIHINSTDRPGEQRFTLFHEVFHILALHIMTPILRRSSAEQSFPNELLEFLADYFAACILMPRELTRRKWAETKDVKQMAETFQVYEWAVWCRLRFMGLVDGFIPRSSFV